MYKGIHKETNRRRKVARNLNHSRRGTMKNRFFAGIIITCMVICMIWPMVAFGEVSKDMVKATHFNVVLAVDGSPSLVGKKGTDPNGVRYDAVELFMGLLTDKGNNVGAVVFNGTDPLALNTGLNEASGFKAKNEILKQIKNTGIDKYTDVGTAALEAVNTLKNVKNDMPSVVILMTDGKTEMETDDKLNQSLANKEKAIEKANEYDIPIYCICLNKNDSAATEEIKEIADRTSGEYVEVKNAKDLKKAYMSFYELIYKAPSTSEEATIGNKGYIDKTFYVPDKGVEEVNLVISSSGELKSIAVTKPDSTVLGASDFGDNIVKTKTFNLIKIVDPEGGDWNVKVKADKGTKVGFNIVYNSLISADIYVADAKKEYELDSSLEFHATLLNDNNLVTKEEDYDGYKAQLVIKNKATGKEQTVNMELSEKAEEGFVAERKFTEAGAYQVYAVLRAEEYEEKTKTLQINVAHGAPTPVSEKLKFTKLVFPFSKTQIQVDLSQQFEDADTPADELSYSIKSNGLKNENVSLDGSQLTIGGKGVGSGKIVVECTDPLGGSGECIVVIRVIHMLPIIAIVLAAVIIVFVALKGIRDRKARNYRFNGNIEFKILPVDDDGSIDTYNSEAAIDTMSEGSFRYRKELRPYEDWEYFIKKGSCIKATANNNEFVIVLKNTVYEKTDNKFKGTKKLKMYIGQTKTLYGKNKKDSRVMVISASHEEFNDW